jgi:hypothetical protein
MDRAGLANPNTPLISYLWHVRGQQRPQIPGNGHHPLADHLGLGGPRPHRQVHLSLGDNTSAIGSIFRSTRLPPESAYYAPVQLITRKVARLTTESQQCPCAQHLKGGSNFISDWLSFTTQTRDGKTNPVAFDDPADDLLTNRFHSSFPQLIPQHFEISPLPEEILSFVEQAL